MNHIRLLLTTLLVVSFVSMTAYAARGSGVGARAKKAITVAGEDQPLHRTSHEKMAKSYQPFSGRVVPLAPDASPLSGVYRIGVGKNFATLSSALLSLAVNGVSGPVTFYFTDASYTESGLLIGTPAGVSATNTLTFQPDSNTAGVAITLTNNASNGGGWVFSGTSYVTINGTKKNGTLGDRDLTIQFDTAQALPSSGLNAPIRVRDGASNITVENCKVFSMYKNDGTDARPGLVMTAGAVPNVNIVFNNNLITRCSFGIITVGGDEYDTGLQITNNSIGNQFGTTFSRFGGQENFVQRGGIYSEWNDGAVISGNQIKGVQTNIANALVGGTADCRRTMGIQSQWGINAVFADNIIDSITTTVPGAGAGSSALRAYGIRANNFGGGIPSNNLIKNNSITNIWGRGAISGGDIGIEIFPGHGDTIVHNSIEASGTGFSGRAAVGMQLTEDQSTSTGHFWILNNALSFTRTGLGSAAAAPYRIFNTVGTDIDSGDGNVLYAPHYGIDALSGPGPGIGEGNDILTWQLARGVDLHSSNNDPKFTSASDVHLTAGSSALDLGVPTTVATDLAGDPRSVTTPDAGAYESAIAPSVVDVGPTALLSPSATGFPQGIAVTGATVRYWNYANATSSYTATLIVKDPLGATLVTATTPVVGHGAFSFDTVNFSFSFTPTLLGNYEFRMISSLGSDVTVTNDSLSAVVGAIPLVGGVEYSTGYEDSASNFGWGDVGGQWINANPIKAYDVDYSLLNAGGPAYAGIKVGGHFTGAHGGTKSWYTFSTEWPAGKGYDDAAVSTLYSPFFDFTGYATRPYMSFFLNIATEPGFDGANMSYSLDSGKTWHQLGAINDTNGINWYNTATYENADDHQAAIDFAGAKALGVTSDFTTLWSSSGLTGSRLSGTDYATGPFGWVYNELKLPAAFIGKNYVRFRLQWYADGNSYDDGGAIDDFKISATGAASTASIAGKVYNDLDANGTFGGGDTPIIGAKVMMTGSKVDSAVTNGSGDFSFTGLAPGLFTLVQKAPPAGSATTVPANGPGNYTISVGPAEAVTGKDFGNFVGSLSGKKYEDMNRNGAFNSEPGLSGFEIDVHRDSANGAIYKSVVTDGSGDWSATVPPGTWVVRQVENPAFLRLEPAAPDSAYTKTTSVATPSYSSLLFGNFKYGKVEVRLNLDQNGDGIKSGADFTTLPAPLYEALEFKKLPAGTPEADTLGRTTIDLVTHATLDTGTYQVTMLSSPPAGYVRTTGATIQTFTISTSGFLDTALYMDFKLMGISGQKFEDHNGNGVKDGGDQPLAGWKIRLSGPVVDSAVTDTAGNYSFSNLPGGTSYTLSEDVQAGWAKTLPAGNYTINPISGSTNGGKDFGNFKRVTISGKKYRDQNNSGSLDFGEVGLSGWQINGDNGLGSVLSDANGDWSFPGVGPGNFTITETSQPGFTLTQPVGGNYAVTTSSGVDVTGLNFGNFNIGDSNQYRTWTLSELSNALEAKPKKRPKAGKPILYPPNSGNLLEDMLKFQGGILRLGLTGQLNLGGKEKAYLQPAKQADVAATFNKKGAVHTGPNRGFDVDIKGKLILKRQKSLPSTKKNDVALAELLTLKINVLASQLGKTPAGFGSLEINRPGNPYNGMTIDDFLAEMDTIMTNWEGQPFYLYDSAAALANAINGAFSTGSTGDTVQPGGGWTSPKLQWVASTYLIDRPILRHGSSTIKARPPLTESPKALPTEFALNQNYPNPFNPSTTISFDLPEDALVTLKLYNIVGQEVATLYNREEIGAGTEDVEFDASSLPSGVYIYRLVAERLNEDGLTTGQTFTQVKKMMLVK